MFCHNKVSSHKIITQFNNFPTNLIRFFKKLNVLPIAFDILILKFKAFND